MPRSEGVQGQADIPATRDDPRWQVIERIVNSPCFQKSERLKAFLKYVGEQYLTGHPERLTGNQIGKAVFGKDDSYDHAEDNTVRTHARQLRLRLLEYFDTFGRDEPIIVEIPKGSYVPVFRPSGSATAEIAPQTGLVHGPLILSAGEAGPAARRPAASRIFQWAGWAVACVLAVALTISAARKPTEHRAVPIHTAYELWPLSALTAQDSSAQIVLCDNSFALLQVAAGKNFPLSEYLNHSYPQNVFKKLPLVRDPEISGFFNQLSRKQLTSFADSSTASMIMHLMPNDDWSVRPARDLKLREIQDGNYILLGSAYSNPWVNLYEHRLNFIVTVDRPLGVRNRNPRPGEPKEYFSEGPTGTVGDDYAAIALIPNEQQGAVLIIQGTKEEGTEAAGRFIAEAKGRRELREKLGIKPGDDLAHKWFEAVLRTKTFAGASAETEIVAARPVAAPVPSH